MQTKTLHKLALALTLWLALHTSALRAQVLGPDTNTSNSSAVFGFDTYGVLYETGTGGSTLSFSGTGTRMFWYPGKAAFRAGYVSGTQWDNTNIGSYSAAFGCNLKVSGPGSFSSGYENIVTGGYSSASGYYNSVTGSYSSATGYHNQVLGVGSTASGAYNDAGNYSSASGYDCYAMGSYSTASGYFSVAGGFASTAFGESAVAGGKISTASGYRTDASAYLDFVIGRYNTGGGTGTSWVAADPLFEIGNGSYNTSTMVTTRLDALVVYKNGSATFQGPVKVAPSSDIPMYNP